MAFCLAADRAAASRGETVGARIGYARTTSRLDAAFGAGVDLEVHFAEMLRKPLSLAFSLGLYNLGGTSRNDITESLFQANSYDAKMNVSYLTVSPMVSFDLPGKSSVYFSGGVGLYGVMLLLDAGLFGAQNTQYHFGLVSGAGYTYELTGSLMLDLNLSFNKFWTSNDWDDWFYAYSEGDKNPFFYRVNVGITYRNK